MSRPSLIAVDWGSSSFRAYLLSPGGEVIDEVASSDGVSTVAPGAFPTTLRRLTGHWLDASAGLPIIASGMVGSRHGWVEAPYVACPAGPRDIAAHLRIARDNGLAVHLVPGLSCEREAGLPDVMRGEEVEILGIAHAGGRLIILPGSHSKWAILGRWPHSRLQDLRHRRGLHRDQGSHHRRRLRAGSACQAARSGVLASASCAAPRPLAVTKGNRGTARRAVRRAQPAADGRTRRGRRGANISPGLLVGAEIAEARCLFPDGRRNCRRRRGRSSHATSRRSRPLAPALARLRRTPPRAAFIAIARDGGLL